MCIPSIPQAVLPTTGPRPWSKHVRRGLGDAMVANESQSQKEKEQVCARKMAMNTLSCSFVNICLLNSTSLRVLDLSYNRLKQLPATLTLLTSLERLLVHGNNLESLPRNIGRLHRLKMLNCSGNRIEELPGSISELEHLQVLIVGVPGAGNKLKSLPSSIGRLQELTELLVDNNELTSLEDLRDLSQLKTISAHANQIATIPSCLPKSLRRLDLSRNCITTLPENVSKMTCQLEVLNLSENQLESLPWDLTRNSTNILLSGNPLLNPAPCRLTNHMFVTTESPPLLELALRACKNSFQHDQEALDQLPDELVTLLQYVRSCNFCDVKCFNTLCAPIAISRSAMGHTSMSIQINVACSQCQRKHLLPFVAPSDAHS